ncbi:MAG: hypothetical protein IGS48_23885 [Oscillatoriales cyanobacterium C42_A2020_001]|nr:hypothetical protein [Leptolyngbyaceae cyanobacterium C42_A2020_001]
MSSYIEEFASQAKLEDRQAVVRQLLKIRYETRNEVSAEVIEKLAEMSSNKMLRLLLTHSWEGLLTSLEENSVGMNSSTLEHDLFRIIGPIEQYYLEKQGEKEALEALAELRFGEIDETVRSAIAYLLQNPAKNSVQILYTLSREELEVQFGRKSVW